MKIKAVLIAYCLQVTHLMLWLCNVPLSVSNTKYSYDVLFVDVPLVVSDFSHREKADKDQKEANENKTPRSFSRFKLYPIVLLLSF